MKREDKLRHDGESVSFEGDGMSSYLMHEHEHKKGKGDTEEHKAQYDHESMHNISHNESPINEGVTGYGSYIKKSEEAAGIVSPTHKMPYPKGHKGIPGGGGEARAWTGPKPWKGEE